MGKFGNLFFIVLAANSICFGLGFVTFGFFIILLCAIPSEFFVGLLLIFFKQHRETGAALLAASGVILLVAGFVCSSVSYRIR